MVRRRWMWPPGGTPGIGKKPVRSDPGGQGNRCWRRFAVPTPILWLRRCLGYISEGREQCFRYHIADQFNKTREANGEVAEQDRLGRRCCVGQVRVDHYRTTENRKVAFGTEPVDQILSVDFDDSGPLRALFYGLQELQESAPALC